MALTLSTEQQLLRDNARQFVRENAPVSLFRKLRDRKDDAGFARELWPQMVELGWAGIVVPERYGGLGLGHTELGLVLEECGRTLVPHPLLSSAVLVGGAVLEGGTEAQRAALLPRISDGSAIAALAFEERKRFDPYAVGTRAERDGDAYVLDGEKRFVLDGHVADSLLVSARTSGSESERGGITLFLIDAEHAGVARERTFLIDGRNAAKIRFERVRVPASAVVGTIGEGAALLELVLDRAAICISAEMLGLAQQAYELTLEYLKTRQQFDATIGSFQALQHRAVDMFCELELAKSVVIDALQAIDERREDLPALASACKARLTDCSRLVTREAIQMHGGIGMTDEHDIGLYLKRAAATEATFGDSAHHRDRFARIKGF